METNRTYYRPIWTCGRYDERAQVAIYYNLIAGMSYYFESFSAQVIGMILSVDRNGKVDINEISSKLNISIESLEPFFKQLEEQGIVSSVYPDKNIISDYRKRVSEYHRNRGYVTKRSTEEKLPYAVSNAEMLYTEKVGGITSAMFELTYNCSERCIHCYNEGAARNDEEKSHRGDRKELTLDEYKKLIDDLYEQGLIKVCLSGGDPFSKPFAWDIIEYLYNKGIAFDIFTNGQRIVNDVKRLADYYPRLIGVSIYSGLPEVHDYITRIKGSWERSMKVIRELSLLGTSVNVKCCVMRPNLKSYYMVADIANECGFVPQFEVNLTDSIEGDKCVSKYLRLRPEELEIVLRDDNIPLYVGKEAPNYGGQKRQMDAMPCGAGENSICITPEGNVIPCCSFHTLFGNIKEESIKGIIEHSKERIYWLSLSLNKYEECGQHDYCDFCNLCPGTNLIEHGTPLRACNVNCHVAKIRYGLAKKLTEGNDPLQGKTVREYLGELPEYIPEKIKREMSQDYSDTRLMVGG